MLQSPFGLFFRFFWTKALVLWAKADILEHIHLEELVFRILEHQSHLAAQIFPGKSVAPDVFPVITDFSPGGAQQAVEQLDQRGFAAACMSDHTDELMLRNREVYIFQGTHLVGSAWAV